MAKGYNEKHTKYWIIGGVFLLLSLIILGIWLYVTGKAVLPLGIVALIFGLFFETRRVTKNYGSTVLIFVISSLFSLIALIPNSKEFEYVFSEEASTVPYYFIFFFCFFSLIINSDKFTHKLHEGITFLQSIALLYWMCDFYIKEFASLYFLIALLISFLFSLYAAYHAFTLKKHSKTSRFYLSIWSSLIMAFFAVNYLISFVFIDSIESASTIRQALFIALQYFLLGVSLNYIVLNLSMIIRFLPGRDSFKKNTYKREFIELKKEHFERYLNAQQPFEISLITLIIAFVWFVFNYRTHLVDRDTSIWILFVCYPLIIYLYNTIIRRFRGRYIN